MIEDIIRDWFNELGDYRNGMSPSNQSSAEDKLTGYLAACIRLSVLSEEESKRLFDELTYKEPFNFDPEAFEERMQKLSKQG